MTSYLKTRNLFKENKDIQFKTQQMYARLETYQ